MSFKISIQVDNNNNPQKTLENAVRHLERAFIVNLDYKEPVIYKDVTYHYTTIPCTIAITPMFTFGTVEFKHFERDKKNREIMVYENLKIPKYPLYGFMRNAENSPTPQYCEQPLVYCRVHNDVRHNLW